MEKQVRAYSAPLGCSFTPLEHVLMLIYQTTNEWASRYYNPQQTEHEASVRGSLFEVLPVIGGNEARRTQHIEPLHASTHADVQFLQRLGRGETVQPFVELVHIVGGLDQVD